MTKVAVKTKTLISIYSKPLTMSLVVAIFVLAAFYVYAVNQTVRNVMNRQALENEFSHLSAHLGELEFEYIALKNSINVSFAESIGFEQVGEAKFVSRQTSVATAVISANRQ
jgi:hypothetical protein